MLQRAFGYRQIFFFFVADALFQRTHNAEIGVHRLKIAASIAGNIVSQRADGRDAVSYTHLSRYGRTGFYKS